MANTSSSSATQIVNQSIINRNTLDAINDSTTKSITDAIMKTVATNAASSSKVAEINIGSIRADQPGSVVSGINITIEQNTVLTQEVVNESLQQNNINTEMAIAIVNDIKSKLDNEQIAKLVSQAEAKQEVSGFALTGGNTAASNVYNRMDLSQVNETTRRFVNVVSNTIEQRSSTFDTKSCIASDVAQAVIELNDITATNGGRVENINLSINQTSQLISQCVFKTIQDSQITQKIAENFGLKIVDETTNKQTAEGEAKAKTDQTITSVFDNLYSLISFAILAVVVVISSFLMKFAGKD
jgi:hypothetical protein